MILNKTKNKFVLINVSIIIHFGINPMNGGSPPKDIKFIKKQNLINGKLLLNMKIWFILKRFIILSIIIIEKLMIV